MTKKWNVTGKEDQDSIKRTKEFISNLLLSGGGRKGIAYGFADASGRGGGSATSESARQFCASVEMRERLVTAVPEEHQANLREILQATGVILRVMECDQVVYVEKVRELTTKVMLLFADHYGWVVMGPTTHELFAHLPQMLIQNGNRGLKALSEESLEAMHKVQL